MLQFFSPKTAFYNLFKKKRPQLKRVVLIPLMMMLDMFLCWVVNRVVDVVVITC